MVQMKKHEAMKNLLKYIIAFVLLAICWWYIWKWKTH